MAKRRSEVVAASLLTAWTDADTAMQIVGASLGVFGAGPLDPTVVLATETPLRNALFDVLLSLVEGGALEMRTTNDLRYAFRWRDDVAVAGLAPTGSPAIDLAVPSPYLAELDQARAERDEALRRADVAEALAAERERLLRPGLDTRDAGVLDVLYAHPADARNGTSDPAGDEPPAAKPAKRKPAKRTVPKKVDPETAPRPPARVRAAAAKPTAAAEPAEAAEAAEAELPAAEVVYLTPPVAGTTPDVDLEPAALESITAADEPAPRPKWSGYAIKEVRSTSPASIASSTTAEPHPGRSTRTGPQLRCSRSVA